PSARGSRRPAWPAAPPADWATFASTAAGSTTGGSTCWRAATACWYARRAAAVTVRRAVATPRASRATVRSAMRAAARAPDAINPLSSRGAQRLGVDVDRLRRVRRIPVLLAIPAAVRARARRHRPDAHRAVVRRAGGGDAGGVGGARTALRPP